MAGIIIGEDWSNVQKSKQFFLERHCFIDCRGKLTVARSSIWGFNVHVYTASHNIDSGVAKEVMLKEVFVGERVWIASDVILYNCNIMDGAIVSVGAVVRNMTVTPFTMVEGNPAKVVKFFNGQEWVRVE